MNINRRLAKYLGVKKAVKLARNRMGLDFHVLSTIILRGWGIGAGFVTILLLPLLLSPTELGYYFSFASILALQLFFELGFNQVITQIAGHTAAELSTDEDGKLAGAPLDLARLGALSALTRRWYLVAALCFAVIVGPAGWLFFGQDNMLDPSIWVAPWAVLVCATAINLYLSPRLALLEGCGRVGNVAQLRLGQSIFGYSAAWIVLLVNGGLWAATCVPVAASIVTIWWLRRERNFSARFVGAPLQGNTISWRHEILPLQWRISLSWISGYFIYSLFTPLIFSTAGPVAAGRFGLSMAIFTGLSTVGMSWMYAKIPEFSRYASRRDMAALGKLFKASAVRSIGVTALLCSLFVGFAQLVIILIPPIASRILGIVDLSFLALAVIASSAVSATAIYLRSFCEEPMLQVSIVTAILTSGAVWVGSQVNITVMLMLYASVICCVMLPWTALVYRRYTSRMGQEDRGPM